MLTPEKIETLIADYYVALRSMNGEQWAEKFAEEAILEDPVGNPPITGGIEVFKQFYTNAINKNFSKIDIQEKNIFIKANQGVVNFNFQGITNQNIEIIFEGMTLFKFNEDGLIVSFKVYWNPTNILPLLY